MSNTNFMHKEGTLGILHSLNPELNGMEVRVVGVIPFAEFYMLLVKKSFTSTMCGYDTNVMFSHDYSVIQVPSTCFSVYRCLNE